MTSLNRKCSILLLCATTLGAAEQVDLSVVNRIKAEASTNSTVTNIMFYLTDVYGLRPTNSPNYRAAGERAVERLAEYGLTCVREANGTLPAAGSTSSTKATWWRPQYSALTGVALAWTSGIEGSIADVPMLATIRNTMPMWRSSKVNAEARAYVKEASETEAP